MMEGSESGSVTNLAPDPGGPKTYGSGTLLTVCLPTPRQKQDEIPNSFERHAVYIEFLYLIDAEGDGGPEGWRVPAHCQGSHG
jgi:hypothetical protein